MNPNLPSSITKGDSYAILESYTTSNLSGGSASCSSNLDGIITHTGQLTTVGTHTITCTVRTGSGKTVTASKTIKITYTAYTITNLITNGSFENNFDNWSIVTPSKNIATINSDDKVHGSKCAMIDITNPYIHIFIDSQSFSIPINHYFYIISSSKIIRINSGYIINGELEQGIIGTLPSSTVVSNNWIKNTLLFQNTTTYSETFLRLEIYQGSNDFSDGLAYFDNVMLIDLTATFGSGNEPDKEWCDKHINYFDGTTTIYK